MALGPILSATVATADPAGLAALYRRWLGFSTLGEAPVAPAVAAAWGAPALAGRPAILLAPPLGPPGGLRFVATGSPPPAPLAVTGWRAIELTVEDVPAVARRLEGGPFRVLGPPRALASHPAIQAMQVAGPAGEALYLTDIRASSGRFELRRPRSAIDGVFIAVLAAPDLERARGVYERRFGLTPGSDRAVRVPVLSAAAGLAADATHRLSSLQLSGGCLLEIDQAAAAVRPPPRVRDHLPGGTAIVTFAVPALDAPPGPPDPPYHGRPTTTFQGDAGERVELIAGS